MNHFSSSQPPKVICIGEALVDRLGLPGEQFKEGSIYEDYLGGAPANVACGLARLGTSVAFLGRLGADQIGERFKELMVERGIQLQALQKDYDRPTRIVKVRRDLNGDRSFEGFWGDEGKGFADQALELLSIKKAWDSISNDLDWLIIGTIPLATQESSRSLLWTVEKAFSSGIRIAIDINWRPTFWDETLNPFSGPSEETINIIRPILMKASLLKLAKEEAIWFFKTSDPFEISTSLPQKPDVVVTDGGSPIVWCLSGLVGETPIISSIDVVDTTGAGDAFNAGLIYKLVSVGTLSNSLKEMNSIIKFAACCGALVCQGKGAISPQPSIKQVEYFLDSR